MKLFGFLLRLVLLIALVVWLADRPGSAQIVWRDFVIETSAAVLLVIIAAIAYALVLVHRVWRMLIDTPRLWKLSRKIGKLEDGQGALTGALAALAAGHASEAGRLAVKARKLMGESSIAQLVMAQSAQLAGDKKAAAALYQALTLKPETAVLGYRGLIMAALREGNHDEAARQAQLLEQVNKDVPWLHLVRFEAAVRYENWGQARLALEKARRGKALPEEAAKKQEAALLLAEAKNALRDALPGKALELAEKASRLAPAWLPAHLILAEAQIVSGHRRVALRTLERAWNRQPHGPLIPLALWASELQHKPLEALKLIERMTKGTQEAYESRMALGDAALRADLWGQARRQLMALVHQGNATAQTYQLLARIEQKENKDERAAAQWLAKAASAAQDPAWQCAGCGAAHAQWEATCRSCGSFNRLDWGVAGQARADALGAERLMSLEYMT